MFQQARVCSSGSDLGKFVTQVFHAFSHPDFAVFLDLGQHA
jgi:hypothetical protein